jgi:hypothetical protein
MRRKGREVRNVVGCRRKVAVLERRVGSRGKEEAAFLIIVLEGRS